MDEVLELLCGDRPLSVLLSFDRFRTLRISISRDGVVRVRAPLGTNRQFLHAHVLRKAPWIFRHLERIQSRPTQAAAQPQYVSGEQHLFLGQAVPLLVRQGPRGSVRLEQGTLEVQTRGLPDPDKVRRLLEAWYQEQAKEIFTRCLRAVLPRFDALSIPRPTVLRVRAMSSRWGSCSRSRAICLNRHLVKAPPECVEYVVVHELCHLRHHGHGKEFYALLAQILPDWKARKALLAKS